MTKIVISIYRYLAKYKAIRWTLLVASFVLFIFLGLQVRFEEDITKLLPSTGDASESVAFSQLKVKDKIYVLITSRDANNPLDPDDLVAVSDEFYEAMEAHDTAGVYFSDILSTIDEDALLDLAMYLADNFPCFVDTSLYSGIEKLTERESVAKNIDDCRSLLLTQAGMAMKDMLAADPIGLRSVAMGTMKNITSGQQIIYDGHLFTPDTTVALAFISPNFKAFDSKSGVDLVKMIETVIEECEANNPEVEILFHGAPVQSVNNSRQVKKDLSLTLTISLILISLGIGICFKNKSTIPLLIMPVIYGAFFALAMMYLVKGQMSLMALGIGAIVLGVALSYCLHVITHYKYVSSPERVIKDQAKPVFLGSLTTIGSFLGLMFTGSELLKDFGLFASFGLVGTTFFSLIFLPHFFNEGRNRKSKKAFRALERFNSHRFEKHTWFIILVILFSALCFYTQRWVTFDADLRNISYTADHVRESINLYNAKTQQGFTTTYYAVSDPTLDGALAKSRTMYDVLDSLKEQGKIHNYSQAATLFPTEAEQEARIATWQEFWNDNKGDEVMGYINDECQRIGMNPLFFEPFKDMVTGDYDFIYPYDDELLPEGLLSNIIEKNDSIYLVFTPVQMADEDKKLVGNALVAKTNCIVIDPMFYMEEMVRSINNDFNIALNISMAFVFIILLLSFRNIILAVIAFVPMTLSWFIVLGVMGILGLQFNLINIVISTFIFGIGVDYSIFVMDGLLSKAKSQSEPQLLVYHKTAIFFSAVVLIVTTGSLLLTSHPALSSIGVATIIGMSSAVVLAYTLQPFMYHALVKFMLSRKMKAKWLDEKRK